MQTDHVDHAGADHGTVKSYVTGFILSIILTVIPFWMVMHPGFSRTTILVTIVALALVQILVHLFCFLHMSAKSEQRWNVLAFAFTLMVVVILIGGSIWIMANVNDGGMMSPDLMNQE
jgi:cytochrome o ubiquinol oxidase operon protein cyoD